MESAVIEKDSTVILENQEIKNSESAENFQKFIYELFENNGVINDLRAYLRGHIIGVLKSAQTGDPLPSQKHFTQRLELQYQALNILITEYLLRMEFNFSLSVFVSEIPLANMVFEFAQSMMGSSSRDPDLRFTSDDVWAVLNYLGIKCDSEHASNIAEMYERGDAPLLLCILCTPIYRVRGNDNAHKVSSEESLASSEDIENKLPQQCKDKCKHYTMCNTCQAKMARVREKYRRKKNHLAQSMNEYNLNSYHLQSVLKNVEVTERNIVDEMFNQLKSVYESEMDIVRNEADNRVKRSLANHEILLQKKREELEQQYKVRSEELSRNVEHKKRFLWGLARHLRQQHNHLTAAMRHVSDETDRLAQKEETLKTQLSEAEKLLRDRGEDMRKQISHELSILENHLEAMKIERDSINREKRELDQMKKNNVNSNKEELKIEYDSLKNEFVALKKYLEGNFESKCVMEKSTMTDLSDSTKIDAVLNNGQDVRRVEVERVVNNLKRHKNVNINQCDQDNVERRSGLASSSEASRSDEVKRLYEQNKRLSDFAAQQRDHIAALSSNQATLHAQLAMRPRTAPMLPPCCVHSVNPIASANNLYTTLHGGSGEQLAFIPHPRIVLPGDAIPFIGTKERRLDTRRYLINRWRCLRRRVSPVSLSRCTHATRAATPTGVTNPSEKEQNHNSIENALYNGNGVTRECESPERAEPEMKIRERSPATVLREAKDKLKASHSTKPSHSRDHRDKSPTSVLREAKKRLRRLEIEAEAVEKSYKDYRRRREETDTHLGDDIQKTGSHKIDLKLKEFASNEEPQTSTFKDFNIRDYYAKFDIGETYFYNKNSTKSHVKPIPDAYSPETAKKLGKNYLDTPLTEFRAYYHSEQRTRDVKSSRDLDIHKNAGLHKDIKTFIHINDINPETFVNNNLEILPNKSAPINLESSERIKSPIKNNIPEKHSESNLSDIPTENNLEDHNSLVIPILNSIEASEASMNSEEINNINDKTKELEILESNIKKIYNLPEKYNLNETDEEINKNCHSDDNLTEIIDAKEYEQCDGNIVENNEVEKISDESKNIMPISEEISPKLSKEEPNNRNLLRIEVESVTEDIKITESYTQEVIVVLETSIDKEHSDIILGDESALQTTIILSPKNDRKNEPNKHENSKSDNITKNIKENDVLSHIYDAPAVVKSSEILDVSKDLNVELDQTEDLDYPDDFSADVDNYDRTPSPVSILRTSEDENFWES